MYRQNKTIQSILFFLAIFAISFSLPLRVVFASSACTCFSTNKDCKTVFVDSKSDSTKGCKKLCSTDLGKSFASSSYATDSDAEATTYKCAQAHDAFVTESKKASGASATSTKPQSATITPILNVPIPNLSFSQAISDGTTVKSNFLADYLTALYRYLIGISVTIAIVMVMIGGLQYVIASGGGDVGKAKKRIEHAIIGLVLLLGVYLILYTTNPQLTLLKSIELENISEVNLPEVAIEHTEEVSRDSEDTSDTSTSSTATSTGGISKQKYTAADCSSLPQAGNPPKGEKTAAPRACNIKLQSGKATYPNISINYKYLGSLDCNNTKKTSEKPRPSSSIKMVILHEGAPMPSVVPNMWTKNYACGNVVKCKLKNGKYNHDWCKNEGTFRATLGTKDTPIGSHYSISRDGGIYQLADEGFVLNHCCRENDSSIGIDIDYTGRSPKDHFSENQYQAIAKLIKAISKKYNFSINDKTVRGHCELGKHTDPPHFDLKHLGDLLGVNFNLSAHQKEKQCNWEPL